VVPKDASQNSAPQLFLFFGCGALTVLFGVFSTAKSVLFAGLNYLAALDSASASFGLIVSPVVIFVCYVVGASVAFLGYMVIVVLHSNWITQVLDVEVSAIRNDNIRLERLIGGVNASFLPLYAGFGFGLTQLLIQVVTLFSNSMQASPKPILFSLGISLISYLALRWKINVLFQMCQKINEGAGAIQRSLIDKNAP
jgi:hypothetical protein